MKNLVPSIESSNASHSYSKAIYSFSFAAIIDIFALYANSSIEIPFYGSIKLFRLFS